MNDAFLFDCAVKLCCSDHVSGYISAKPVIDTREKLTEQRLHYLYQMIQDDKGKIISKNETENEEILIYNFKKAIELTCADVACGVIAVEPILYDRNDKICETIEFYFNLTKELMSSLSVSLSNSSLLPGSNNSADASKTDIESKTIIIPVYKKMKKSKIKKGKR